VIDFGMKQVIFQLILHLVNIFNQVEIKFMMLGGGDRFFVYFNFLHTKKVKKFLKKVSFMTKNIKIKHICVYRNTSLSK